MNINAQMSISLRLRHYFLNGVLPEILELKKSAIFTLAFMCLACLSMSQVNPIDTANKDSSATEKTKYKKFVETTFLLEDSVLLKPNQYTKIDTVMRGLHYTHAQQFQPVQQAHHVTSAALPLTFNPFSAPGLQLGMSFMDAYIRQSGQLRFHNAYSPYTQLKYFQGGVDERLLALDVDHAQSFSERFSAGITHKSRKTDGLYQNESGQSTRTGIVGRYHSVNHQYQLLASVLWNNFTLNHNGGITTTSSFPFMASNVERVSQPSFLGENAQTIFRNMELGVRQMYYLGKMDSVLLEDSNYQERLIPRSYFTHKATYKKSDLRYGGDTSSFYPANHTFFNEIVEYTEWRELRNELGWGLYLNPKDELRSKRRPTRRKYSEQVFYGGVELRNISTKQWGVERLNLHSADSLKRSNGFFNIHLFGKLRKNVTPYTHFSGDLNYVALGNNFSDYQYDLKLKQTLFRGLVIQPQLRGQLREPQFLESENIATYARWKTDFKKQFNNELAASLSYKGQHSLKVAAIRSDNYIFYNELNRPTQADSGINYLQITLKSRLRLWKFHFVHQLSWQQISETSPATVPEWLAYANYYFESPLFKQALQLRIGVDFRYFSEYYANAFMPGLNQFYVQNTRKVGNYPMFDAYVSARIKRWNGFVKFEHVAEGLFGYKYELLPYYPAYPRAMRWGVAWRFYD